MKQVGELARDRASSLAIILMIIAGINELWPYQTPASMSGIKMHAAFSFGLL